MYLLMLLLSCHSNFASRPPTIHHITCYAGTEIIYEGFAEGRIIYGDTLRWTDLKHHNEVSTNAPCIIVGP